MAFRRVFVLALLIGCGGSPPTPATPAAAPPAADYVSPPFTADDLRAGLPTGTEIHYRMTEAGKPTTIEHWIFTAADETSCTIHTLVYAEDETTLVDDRTLTAKWTELATHGQFPAALTTRSDSSIDVPAGHFDTWLFEVQPSTPGEPTRRLHFARNLAGPPIWMELTAGGQVVGRMELLSRKAPGQ